MAYSIEYNPEKKKIYPLLSSTKPKWLLLAVCLLISVFILQRLDYGEQFCSLLLPGDPKVTTEAFSEMSEQIRAGRSIGEAATAFCLEILENG